MDIENLYKIFQKNRKITIDSRNCEANSIFFALKGENFDGNQFADKALYNGCSYAVIDTKNYKKDNRYILVDDVLKALQDLANYHRRKLEIPIIAITGTNGKTTTKELITEVLKQDYKVVNTAGNLNNHIGVPLTLLSMDSNTELGVVEMGANHQGEIKLLCEIAQPDYGIITNIGKAHLEGFGSFENIIKTKGELYNYLNDNHKVVFYNSGNEILKSLISDLRIEVISFNDEESNVKGKKLDTNLFLKAKLEIGGKALMINTNLIGAYNLENILAAASIGNYFKVSSKKIKKAIENYVPKNNRSQFLETQHNRLYLDAYNANPTSVDLALKNFISLNISNKVIILGDMLELGDNAVDEHKKLLNVVSKQGFSKIILVGEIYNSLQADQEILQFSNVDGAINWLKNNNFAESNILIKGSRGIQLEKVVEYL